MSLCYLFKLHKKTNNELRVEKLGNYLNISRFYFIGICVLSDLFEQKHRAKKRRDFIWFELEKLNWNNKQRLYGEEKKRKQSKIIACLDFVFFAKQFE